MLWLRARKAIKRVSEEEMRIFVDVDDTLVLFKGDFPHPYGVIQGDSFKLNHKLVERLKNFKGEIIVWSGGGSTYAGHVAKRVLPESMNFTARTKEGASAKEFVAGDIIVDDQPEYYTVLKERGVRVFNPFEEWEEAKEKK